jgi:hypothetical protein
MLPLQMFRTAAFAGGKMKRIVFTAALLLAALPAQAISRYSSTRMSCGQIRAAIGTEGAAIMRYQSARAPGHTMFDRYVRDDRFCEYEEYAKLVFIPAADTPECPVYRCEKIELDDFPFFRHRHH